MNFIVAAIVTRHRIFIFLKCVRIFITGSKFSHFIVLHDRLLIDVIIYLKLMQVLHNFSSL